MSRRRFVASTTSAAVLAGSASTGWGLDLDFHLSVARAARELSPNPKVLRLLMPDGCMANVQPIIDKFYQLAGISVETREVPVDEINSQLMLDSLGGIGDYDLALPATFGMPDLAANNVIRPITEFAERYEPKGFRDGILYSIGDSFDQELYGFQTDGDTYLMFYHKDWLDDPNEQHAYEDRFGQPLQIPLTWDELDQQMAFFHRPEENRFGGALFRTPRYLAWEWWVRFHSKGVWPLSAEIEPQIASDEGVSALEDMIRASQSLYPQAQSAGIFENWRHFGEGNTYCNIGWGGSQKYLNSSKSSMRGRMVYGPTPCGLIDGKHISIPYFNWGWNYVVTSISEQPELAYLFALFASTSEMSTASVRAKDGFFDPFRPEHYEDPTIQKIYSPEFLKVHESSLRSSIPDLYLANQSEYFRVLSQWLDHAVNGGMDPKLALDKAATQWSVLNLRAGRDLQTQRWLALRAKYPLNVQEALRDI